MRAIIGACESAFMNPYHVNLTALIGHQLPSLLVDVGTYIQAQPHGTLGWFDSLFAEPIPEHWSEEHSGRLQKAGFAFLKLPDGSLLALLSVGKVRPVVLLGSEG